MCVSWASWGGVVWIDMSGAPRSENEICEPGRWERMWMCALNDKRVGLTDRRAVASSLNDNVEFLERSDETRTRI